MSNPHIEDRVACRGTGCQPVGLRIGWIALQGRLARVFGLRDSLLVRNAGEPPVSREPAARRAVHGLAARATQSAIT